MDGMIVSLKGIWNRREVPLLQEIGGILFYLSICDDEKSG